MFRLSSFLLGCFVSLITVDAALFSLSQTSGEADSCVITGRIVLPAANDESDRIIQGRALQRYGKSHQHSDRQPAGYTLSEMSAVYLQPVDHHVSAPRPVEHARLDQLDMMFRPLVLPIVVGTTVDFPNSDKVFHNVFSYSRTKEFDLGKYATGRFKSVTFDKPGIVKVYCDIHSNMYATILVLENALFAVPDTDGSYIIRGVPSGSYDVTFWYAQRRSETKRVEVRPDNPPTVNFGD